MRSSLWSGGRRQVREVLLVSHEPKSGSLMKGGDKREPWFPRNLAQKTVETEKATKGARQSRQEKKDRCRRVFFLESTPQARLPAPRKPALRQAQSIIRRYFLSVFATVVAMPRSAGKRSGASAAADLRVWLPFTFFVDFASIITLRTSVMTKSSKCGFLLNLARMFTIAGTRTLHEPGFPGNRWPPGC